MQYYIDKSLGIKPVGRTPRYCEYCDMLFIIDDDVIEENLICPECDNNSPLIYYDIDKMPGKVNVNAFTIGLMANILPYMKNKYICPECHERTLKFRLDIGNWD